MLNLNTLVLTSENPANLQQFYSKMFGKEPEWGGKAGEFRGWKIGDSFLVIGPHSDVHGQNPSPGRIMFGFTVEDVEAEYKRMISDGASKVQPPYHPEEQPDMWLATLEDPDGNYFQLGTSVNF